MKVCAYPGGLCRRKATKRRDGANWCAMHYGRLERHDDLGPPGALKPGNLRETQQARRTDPYYGDSTFPGAGRIMCAVCGRSARDHRVSERCY